MQVGRNVNKQIDFLCPIRPEEESQWSGTRAQHQVDWGDLVRRKRERILGILKPKSAEESRFPAHHTGCSLTQVLCRGCGAGRAAVTVEGQALVVAATVCPRAVLRPRGSSQRGLQLQPQ